MKIQRRQFLQSTALIGFGLIANITFGDRNKKNPAAIADTAQSNIFHHLSPSGEFFFYGLSAACST